MEQGEGDASEQNKLPKSGYCSEVSSKFKFNSFNTTILVVVEYCNKHANFLVRSSGIFWCQARSKAP